MQRERAQRIEAEADVDGGRRQALPFDQSAPVSRAARGHAGLISIAIAIPASRWTPASVAFDGVRQSRQPVAMRADRAGGHQHQPVGAVVELVQDLGVASIGIRMVDALHHLPARPAARPAIGDASGARG